jgi:hypothetical protein
MIAFIFQEQTVEFVTLADYEKSIFWRFTRARYRASDLPQECTICGDGRFQLHHLHYRNIGDEDLADLMPLCGDHHYEVEKHIRASRPDLDREAATFDYLERVAGRAEGERIRNPRRLDPLSSLGVLRT